MVKYNLKAKGGGILLTNSEGRVTVYVASVSYKSSGGDVYPAERQAEIDATGNETLRRERHAVWRLLCQAIKDIYGVEAENVTFRKASSGKWHCDLCHFSLSHGGGAVAVAIADAAVGVDIEELSARRSARFAERTLNGDEMQAYEELSEDQREEYLLRSWCAKEAIFKAGGGDIFLPRDIDTQGENNLTFAINVSGRSYILAVSSKSISELSVHQC